MEMGNSNTSGSFDSPSKRNRSFQSVIDFIHSAIPEFVEETKRGQIEVEDGLTQELCDILIDTCNDDFPYYFFPQNMENPKNGNSPRTDFAAKTRRKKTGDRREPFVQFEAKRLCSTLGKKREKEYVIGQYQGEKRTKNSGGIERFKNGTHGKTVNYAGLIGYLQDHSTDYWEEKINGWIQEEIQQPNDPTLEWNVSDLLKPEFQKQDHCQLYSQSHRIENDPITFVHLWIDLSK